MSFVRSRLLLGIVAFLTLIAGGFSRFPVLEHIVKDHFADHINIPYIVSLVYKGVHECSGSIINQRTVLTAAQCLNNKRMDQMRVHTGGWGIHSRVAGSVPVEDAHIHPRYSEHTLDYDIAIIRLSYALYFDYSIKPIQLPQPYESLYDYTPAITVGWSCISNRGPCSPELLSANVEIVNQQICGRELSHNKNLLTSRMICAANPLCDANLCNADLGGPLVVNQTLIGIVSRNADCTEPCRPGVYVHVAMLMHWVRLTLNTNYNELIGMNDRNQHNYYYLQ